MPNQASYAAPRLDLGVAFEEYVLNENGNQFIGTDVLGSFNATRQSASFSKITKESILQVADTLRASRSAYGRGDYSTEDDTYSCQEHGWESVVDDKELALYANDFDAEMAAMKIVGGVIKRNQEIRVATAVFNASTWTGPSLYTDHSSNPWATIATDIVGQVLDAKEKVRSGSGVMADTLILSQANFTNLLKNTAIRNQFPGSQVVTLAMIEQAMASIFGLTKLLVGGASQNTAKEGQAASVSDIWGDTYVMVAKTANSGASLDTPCIGRSFLWTEDSPTDLVVEEYREEQARGTVVRARQNCDEKIIEPAFGHLMDVKA